MKQKVLLSILCVVLGITTLFLCIRQFSFETKLNAQLNDSYSRVLAHFESIHQIEQEPQSPQERVMMLQGIVNKFCGQLSLFVDDPPNILTPPNCNFPVVYMGFDLFNAGLSTEIIELQEDPSAISALIEKLDEVYMEIKDLDDIESVANIVRYVWN